MIYYNVVKHKKLNVTQFWLWDWYGQTIAIDISFFVFVFHLCGAVSPQISELLIICYCCGSHVGKALSVALAEKGIFVTIVDFSEEKGKEVAALVEKENAKFHSMLEFPSAMFIRCDVTNTSMLTIIVMIRK